MGDDVVIRPGTAHCAFPIFDTLPDGCCPWRVADATCEPHIHAGEFAVIDCTDRAIMPGELFLVRLNRGSVIWQILRHPRHRWVRGAETFALHPVNRPRSIEESDAWWRAGRTMYAGDGPIGRTALEARIIGRVIGVLGELSR